MEERVLISLLLDFYGALLTERQKQCLALHHEDDMSLGEIAEQLGVSRQAIYDNMQRARQLLEMYESKLHLVAQYEKRESVVAAMRRELDHLQSRAKDAEFQTSTNTLYQLVAQMEG
ncbi:MULTISPECIES: putative DNA-binding protein [unclassified Veillonella]|uniref:putative DNA-binding protein n=1 Tax=unclassified Veillonella TaxID=2630086 RepID=UPI00138973AE|nr:MULTISPECIES: putative DNA-binding protein [unclassified Veillonella]KAF1683974.1 DNA-binding protein [Veillonella sp. R32]